MSADGAQVGDSEAACGLTEVGVAVPVEETGLDTVERATAREVGEAHAQCVVGDGRDEAGKGGDTVLLRIHDADAAELELAEWSCGVDAHLGADSVEDALS